MEIERGAARKMHAETDLVHVGPPRGKRRTRSLRDGQPESPVISSAPLVQQDCLHHRGTARHRAMPPLPPATTSAKLQPSARLHSSESFRWSLRRFG